MPRRKQCRRIGLSTERVFFKPAGVPTRVLEQVLLEFDELEAIRLADVLDLYHDQAAKQMGISRRTFGRILDSGRKKVARALVEGMALRIEGGEIETIKQCYFTCGDCNHGWELPFCTEPPANCPKCDGQGFHRHV